MILRNALSAIVWAGVAGMLGGAQGAEPARAPVSPQKPNRSYGTALQWENKFEAAAKKAERDRKLLLVLAVAGHFEDPFFT
jgi:hypothetical protein